MKKLLSIVLLVFLAASLALTASAEYSHDPRVIDRADLLSPYEEAELTELLDTLSERLQFDIVVVTEDDMNGQSSRDYAADTYDYNNYGYGSEYDGALFLLNMEDREMYILGTGLGTTAINYGICNAILDKVEYDVGEGWYFNAFKTFAEECEFYVEYARNGGEYTEPFDIGSALLISVVIGIVVGIVTICVMRSGMKTVKFQSGASNYIKPGSMDVTRAADLFLYSTVTRTAKPKDDGGNFRSSSGRSHSGGGRRF